jgi:3-oxoacyl-[acyl-carrier protein] reductase
MSPTGQHLPAGGAAFDVSGRVTVVTGAGSGIGRASAIHLAAAGATVVCADIDAAAARKTAGQAGGDSYAVPADVAQRASVEQLVKDVIDLHGRLDAMCNIAGIITEAPLLELSERELDRIVAVNLKGVLFGSQAAGRAMAAAGRGSIVNMSSAVVDRPAAGVGAYAITKAGVTQLTKTLAVELGPHRVRVNAIAPGITVTAMTERHYTRADGTIDEESRDARLASLRALSPLGTVGTPEDIAYAVRYLLSDASHFVTGQVLRVNGGAMMP